MSVQQEPNRTYHEVGLLGPIILVFLGFVFLSNTTGVLGWGVWGSVWKLWPLILVLIGVDLLFGRRWLRVHVPEYQTRLHSGRLVGALVLIFLGGLFLLFNLGALNWTVGMAVWRLWPIILVGVGLNGLLGRTIPYGSLVALLLTVVIVFGSLFTMNSAFTGGALLSGATIDQPLSGVNKASVELSPGIGRVRIGGGAAADKLVEGRIDRTAGDRVVNDFSSSNGVGSYVLRQEGIPFEFHVGPSDMTWDLRLTEQIPLDLRIHTGVGQSELDLSKLTLSNLELDTGVGQSTITLPRKGSFQGIIKGGIGETSIRVPKGLAVKVYVRTGIGEARVPSGWRTQDSGFVSPDYDTAAEKANLEIDGGIGQIRVLDGF